MAKNFKNELFAFAVACGMAEADCRERGVRFSDVTKHSSQAVHHIIAEFGLFNEYIDYLTENTGIEADSFFENWKKANAEIKKEVTKTALFEMALTQGFTYAHARVESEKNPTEDAVEIANFCEAQVDMMTLFLKDLGIIDEYDTFLMKKLLEI